MVYEVATSQYELFIVDMSWLVLEPDPSMSGISFNSTVQIEGAMMLYLLKIERPYS